MKSSASERAYGCISRDTCLRELNVIKPNRLCYYVQHKGF